MEESVIKEWVVKESVREDFRYAALGIGRHHLLTHPARPDAPVVPDHPHQLCAAARRLVARPSGRGAAAWPGRHRSTRPVHGI
jgi:hypothetical protein